MHPKAQEGDWVIFEPVIDLSELQVGDIVFCLVGGEFTYRAQVIAGISAYNEDKALARGHEYDPGCKRYLISTQRGKHIATISGHDIIGRLVEVIYA